MIPFVFFRTAKMHFSQRELPSPYVSYIVIHSSLTFHKALRNTFFEVLLSPVVYPYPRAKRAHIIMKQWKTSFSTPVLTGLGLRA